MTSSMPWVKLYTEMLDDPKIGRLTAALRWRFVELVLLAGECDAEGYLLKGDEPLTIDDIAWRLRGDPDNLKENMDRLQEAGLIENQDGVWLISKFAERQGRSQSEKRKQWREAQQRKRGKDEETDEETDKEDEPAKEENDTPDDIKSIMDESSMSHTPRVEESREEVEKIREEVDIGAGAPLPDPLAPDTPGALAFFEILGREFTAKKRKVPEKFTSYASKQKFLDDAEGRLTLTEIKDATTRACEKNITSIVGAVDFVAKWDTSGPPSRNGRGPASKPVSILDNLLEDDDGDE